MTADNRKQNVADELARAAQCLAAAEALVALGLSADAISRTYYAAFHLVRALLFSRGTEPRSHQGAIHLFNTEIVRTGLMPNTHNRMLSGLQRARELADYDSAINFDIADAQRDVAAVRAFEAEVLRILTTE